MSELLFVLLLFVLVWGWPILGLVVDGAIGGLGVSRASLEVAW